MRSTSTLAAILVWATLASAAVAQPSVRSIDVSPRLPTSADEIVVLVRGEGGPGCTYMDFPETAAPSPLAVFPTQIVVTGTVEETPVPCPSAAWADEIRLGKLPTGTYLLRLFAPSAPIDPPIPPVLLAEKIFTVTAPSDRVELHNGNFVVVAEWIGGPAANQRLEAVTLGSESGYFWSFSSTNVELTVKILDARPVNQRYWVFLAPMTTLGLRVSVFDARSGCAVFANGDPGPPPVDQCPSKVYTLPPGLPDTLIDLDAFAG